MSDDTEAREARFFAAVDNPPHPTEEMKELVRHYGHLLAPKRADSMGLPDPIPAAAALLRSAGWRVEEPVCPTCSGEGRVIVAVDQDGGMTSKFCPTCNGTGAATAPGGGR